MTDPQCETATLAPGVFAAIEVETATCARVDNAETTASAMVVQAPRKNEVRGGSSEPLPWREPPQPLLESEALWRIFRQLALGIWALHQTGTLHCDIKPGNVMVARSGRVVLLDFGLVTSRARGLFSDGTYAFAGTPAYISPEQVLGEPASEASDWFAFGVILYEALCGRRPFPTGESLRDKVKQDAPLIPASPHVPEVLRELCMALLRREASARPTGLEVLEQLGLSAEAREGAPESGAQRLVGRETQLEVLHQALETMREGRPVTVFLHGRSGMGKTALAHRFLSHAMAEGVVVLVGRCFERETVPYKAFDGLVDSLMRYLRRLLTYQVEALRPRNMADLLRVFPVLERVSALAVGARTAPAAVAPEPLEFRRRAFRAYLHAGAALVMAGQRVGPERTALLGVAAASAKRLEREGVHYARGCAALLRGAVAAQDGHRTVVLSELEKASARFDEAELVLHAACARRHGGALRGGEEGGKAVESADAILRGQGILDGARWAAMMAPGYPGV